LSSGREVCYLQTKGEFHERGHNAAFSAAGKHVAAVSQGFDSDRVEHAGWLQVWNVDTGQEIQALKFLGVPEAIAFSHDGRSIAVVGEWLPPNGNEYVGLLRIWEAETGQERLKVDLDVSPNRLTFSSDGQLVAVAGSEGLMTVNATDGRKVRAFQNVPPGLVTGLTFTHDGRTLILASADEKTRHPHLGIYEVATGTLRYKLQGHHQPITCLALSSDGRYLASGSADGTALVWDLDASPPDADAGLKPAEKAELWLRLGDLDGSVAWNAMQRLRAAPADAVKLLRGRVPPVQFPKAGPEDIARLIADLDADSFTMREQATRELRKIGPAAEPFLARLVASGGSPEQRRRARELCDELKQANQSLHLLRPLRAIEVLERLGTADARRVLESLARGQREARITIEARLAMHRLGHSPMK
jgi:dipeptidyl aminopeptidase/acylaminoacyl peptidase